MVKMFVLFLIKTFITRDQDAIYIKEFVSFDNKTPIPIRRKLLRDSSIFKRTGEKGEVYVVSPLLFKLVAASRMKSQVKTMRIRMRK